jgi:hypothetical protein
VPKVVPETEVLGADGRERTALLDPRTRRARTQDDARRFHLGAASSIERRRRADVSLDKIPPTVPR